MALLGWASRELATELARCRECDGAAAVLCVVFVSWRYVSRSALSCFKGRSLILRSTPQANPKCCRATPTVQPTGACLALWVLDLLSRLLSPLIRISQVLRHPRPYPSLRGQLMDDVHYVMTMYFGGQGQAHLLYLIHSPLIDPSLRS
jgi:hypothetical protein